MYMYIQIYIIQRLKNQSTINLTGSPRFLCRLTALIKLLVAVQRQRVLFTETIEFASPAIGSAHFHVSWLSDFIFYHKPYINRFTNHFSIHS